MGFLPGKHNSTDGPHPRWRLSRLFLEKRDEAEDGKHLAAILRATARRQRFFRCRLIGAESTMFKSRILKNQTSLCSENLFNGSLNVGEQTIELSMLGDVSFLKFLLLKTVASAPMSSHLKNRCRRASRRFGGAFKKAAAQRSVCSLSCFKKENTLVSRIY